MLFSEPKIPQFNNNRVTATVQSTVSVLFSEPKIPQWKWGCRLRKASFAFQCSSASRKFLNSLQLIKRNRPAGFSALQRAENSSIAAERDGGAVGDTFQCSSASRKFLNRKRRTAASPGTRCFSALQRAENSSIERHCGTSGNA